VIAFFFFLGFFFMLKKNKPEAEVKNSKGGSTFVNGLIVAILNPQTIPYWVFVLAYLKSSDSIHLESWNFVLFLIGVSGGKFIILSLYSYLSDYIKKRISNLDVYVSKGIGGLLLTIGLIQAINYFFFQ
jgi:threonine/homoserine/homoserine lactone efflux protein